MARFTRLQVLNTMVQTGLVPVFYWPDAEVAVQVARACHRAGLPLLEFTNRGEQALQVFAAIEAHCTAELPGMITGVGSIVDAPTAAAFVNLGASFVVGPVLNPEVARLCNRRKIAYSPGCGSVSEISAAEELGCEIVKIFPAREVGGPAFVKQVRGPMPWTSIMPTGGVEPTEASLRAWFEAGVACVGMGSGLVPDALLRARDYDGISRNVEKALALVRSVRPSAPAGPGGAR
jgi:2-dehydro-3-deoxyphosphogluconate aldolase / (4S)-4-hydroxy-2-oxoglutarate aldolase